MDGAAAPSPAFADFRGQIAPVCQGAIHMHVPQTDTKTLDIHAVAQTLHGITPAQCPTVDLFGNRLSVAIKSADGEGFPGQPGIASHICGRDMVTVIPSFLCLLVATTAEHSPKTRVATKKHIAASRNRSDEWGM
jgi:hypothetical protein